MKISLTWLQTWLSIPLESVNLKSILTQLGLEVSEVKPACPLFSGVIIADIVSISPHPNADKLNICQVNIGAETPIQVVCGAQNIRVGIKVPFATEGALLANGHTIKETDLRGVTSHGMICSESELSLSEQSTGIMILPDDAPPGESVFKYLDLDDQVIEIELTPNRGDCLSVCGVAREVVAATGCQLTDPTAQITTTPVDATLVVPKANVNTELAPVYCLRRVTGIDNTRNTPLWMKERLRRSGLQPVSLIVDITQYVMLTLGQPLHAFSTDKISGELSVRLATKNDKITLLNKKQHTLNNSTLIITDEHKALAIAGVMGSQESGVSTTSTDIILESAHFIPTAIAGTARDYGLATEASHRFERGVDPQLTEQALRYATRLIVTLAGGLASKVVTYQSRPLTTKKIQLRKSKITDILGIMVSKNEVISTLRKLNIPVSENESGWLVSIPSYRFDLQSEIDLIEEIIRVIGFNRLNVRLPNSEIAPRMNEANKSVKTLRETLVSLGFFETINYSFIDEKWSAYLGVADRCISLANPITASMRVMRQSLWPPLIEALTINIKRQHKSIHLFELGAAFSADNTHTPIEQPLIAGLSYGSLSDKTWSNDHKKTTDFYHLKQTVSTLLERLRWPAMFETAEHPFLHPNKSAKIVVDQHEIGWVGALHPRLGQQFKLTDDVFLFEISLTKTHSIKPIFSPPSKFPTVRRDLSLLVPKNCPVDNIIKKAKQVCASQLKDAYIFDVYSGKGIDIHKKSVAIALVFQDQERTLAEVDVQKLIDRVLTELLVCFSITLRE